MGRLMSIVGMAVALVLAPITLQAQTPTAQWTQQNVASTTQAAGLTYRLYITPFGSPTNPAILLTGVVCTGTAPTVNCTAPLGPAVAASALAPGTKTVLSAQDGTTAEAMSAPFSPGASAPTTFRIQ